MSVPEPPATSKPPIERVLEESLQRVDSPAAARTVVARVERLAGDRTEQDLGEAAAGTPASPARAVEQASATPSPETAVASVLTTAAAEVVAPTPEAPEVLAAAQQVLRSDTRVSPGAERGRRLLKSAVLRRMGPLQSLDARLYLAINEAPHPGWLDSLAYALAIITIGGWVWVVGTLVAYLFRVPRGWQAVMRLLPCVVGATWIVEYPVKGYFRRRRPFVEIVRALVIGKRPGSWSFPSGHTASSFASAWVLSTVWPSRAPAFFGLAGLVGLSRIYLGAHYPGDVMSGALAGITLAELVRRGVVRWFRL
jgi:membrane-associated phospholipid phosphatase